MSSSPVASATRPAGASAAATAKPRARRLIVALLALIPLFQLLVMVPVIWTGAVESRDHAAYRWAAERIRDGEPLYEPVPPGPHVPRVGAPYLYPPFLAGAASLIPLTGVAFARLALLAGVLCFWFYAACLARVSMGRVSWYGVLLWGALLTAGLAALGTIYVGQIDSLIWALFGAALAVPAARGFALAAAALLKPFAIWPLGLAVWRERRPAVRGAALAIALAVVSSAIAMGPVTLVQYCFEWLTAVYPSLSQGQFAYGSADDPPASIGAHIVAYIGTGNLSLGFLPLQLAHAAGWSFPGPELPAWARIYLTAVGIGGPILVLWLTRRRSPELRYAAVMAAAVLLGPIFRATYSPILYAVAAAWIAERRVARCRCSLSSAIAPVHTAVRS